jgi:uncharacterized membrane protein YeaQ/YmgE (transglycosylase-associated protein family)
VSEPTTDEPDKRRWSYAAGCLSGLLGGIAGTVLGRYLGEHIDAQLVARLRADGHLFESPLRLFSLILGVCGACCGWLFGWLLTAFLPRKRLRTRGDYLLISVVGLSPICLLIALSIVGAAIGSRLSHRAIRQTAVPKDSANAPTTARP